MGWLLMSENGETGVGSADSVGGLTAGCSTAYPQAQFPPESVSYVFTLRYTSPGREGWRRLVCRTPPCLGTASCTVSPSLLSGEVVDSLTLQCWDSYMGLLQGLPVTRYVWGKV